MKSLYVITTIVIITLACVIGFVDFFATLFIGSAVIGGIRKLFK